MHLGVALDVVALVEAQVGEGRPWACHETAFRHLVQGHDISLVPSALHGHARSCLLGAQGTGAGRRPDARSIGSHVHEVRTRHRHLRNQVRVSAATSSSPANLCGLRTA